MKSGVDYRYTLLAWLGLAIACFEGASKLAMSGLWSIVRLHGVSNGRFAFLPC